MNGRTVAVLILLAVFVAFVLAEAYRRLYHRPPEDAGRHFWKPTRR